MVAPGCGGLRPGQAAQLRRHGVRHGVGQRRVVGDQDGLRALVVLGLRQQVDGDAARVGGAVGQDHHLGRPGDAVDADAAEHLALGLRDIGVAGADDAVHRGDASRCRRPGPPPPARRRCGRSPPPRRAAPPPAPAGSARRPASARTSPAAPPRRRGPGWRSSARRTGRPPCRPARRGRPRRAASSACPCAARPRPSSRCPAGIAAGGTPRSGWRRRRAPRPARAGWRWRRRRSRRRRCAGSAGHGVVVELARVARTARRRPARARRR